MLFPPFFLFFLPNRSTLFSDLETFETKNNPYMDFLLFFSPSPRRSEEELLSSPLRRRRAK